MIYDTHTGIIMFVRSAALFLLSLIINEAW